MAYNQISDLFVGASSVLINTVSVTKHKIKGYFDKNKELPLAFRLFSKQVSIFNSEFIDNKGSSSGAVEIR